MILRVVLIATLFSLLFSVEKKMGKGNADSLLPKLLLDILAVTSVCTASLSNARGISICRY